MVKVRTMHCPNRARVDHNHTICDFRKSDLNLSCGAMIQKKYLVCFVVVLAVLVGVAPRLVVKMVLWLHPLPQYSHSHVKEGGNPVRCIKEQMTNWAGNTEMGEVTVFYPNTVEGVENVVKMVKQEGSGVRAVGARGTWNSWMWLEPPPYLISLVPRGVADRWYRLREEVSSWLRQPGPLGSIQGVVDTWEEGGKQMAAVKIGAGVLVQQLISWGAETGWSLGSNVVIERATVGGVVATMGHGAGQGWPSVADYVLGVEFVDVEGERRVLKDKKDVETFISSFGLMGVAVYLTLRMGQVRYTQWSDPPAVDMEQILPRPGTPIPREIEELFRKTHYQQFTMIRSRSATFLRAWTAKDLTDDNTPVVSRLFTQESETEITILFTFVTAMQDFLLFVSQKLTILYKPLKYVSGMISFLTYRAAMVSIDPSLSGMIDLVGKLSKLPHQEKIITTLDANNPFRGGSVKKFRVFEFEFPILENGENLDWSFVQAAVWDCLDIADRFRSEGNEALDDHLDVRLMSSSAILLSPFSSTPSSSSISIWGWAGIAVASTSWVKEDIWQRFMFEVVSSWSSYTSPQGNKILPRPHWAKEMPQTVGEQEPYGYLRRAYRDQLMEMEPRLVKLLENISRTNLSQAFAMFATQHHLQLFKDFKR